MAESPEANAAREKLRVAVQGLFAAVDQHPGDHVRILGRALEMCIADREFVAASGALPPPKTHQ